MRVRVKGECETLSHLYSLPAKVMGVPSSEGCAKSLRLSIGKPRSSSFLRISMPTAPVAPATPTRGLRIPFFAADVARLAVRAAVVPTCVYTLRIAACDASLFCVRPARRREDATVDAIVRCRRMCRS